MGRLASLGVAAAIAHNFERAQANTFKIKTDVDPTELSITALQELFAKGFSSEAIVAGYLARIEREDALFRSVIAVNPRAIETARVLDLERHTGRSRGALHGVPILLKDNIESIDPMPTTAGSLALARSQATRDADLVVRLRAAGAVILGKTNLSEWANFRSTRSMSGWSAVGGQTGNAYDPKRNPSGSSSGSATAAARSFCAVAIGTETDGSILSPAALNGIVGFKPTQTRVSGRGVIPLSPRQDVAGPMGRNVADVAAVATILFDQAFDVAPVLTARAAVLKGRRIGWWPGSPNLRPDVLAQCNMIRDLLIANGVELVDLSLPAGLQQFGAAEFLALLYEFKQAIDAYLGDLAPARREARSLAELIDFNRREAAREMPFFGQEIFEQSVACGPLTEPKYLEAVLSLQQSVDVDGLATLFTQSTLDLIVSPGSGPAELIDPIWGNRRDTGGSSLGSAAAVAGYPSLTLPIGLVRDMPVGLTLVARRNDDAQLLRLAAAMEKAANRRIPPEKNATAR
jgi:amidase